MTKIKRDWDLISDEKRKESIDDIIHFFKNERDEEIGIIAAEKILDHFLKTVGIQIYNKSVEESIIFLKNRFESLEIDMRALLKKIE
jgi:uncharacterized protein (DUF2164 family)